MGYEHQYDRLFQQQQLFRQNLPLAANNTLREGFEQQQPQYPGAEMGAEGTPAVPSMGTGFGQYYPYWLYYPQYGFPGIPQQKTDFGYYPTGEEQGAHQQGPQQGPQQGGQPQGQPQGQGQFFGQSQFQQYQYGAADYGRGPNFFQ